jgi:hypothetical protein
MRVAAFALLAVAAVESERHARILRQVGPYWPRILGFRSKLLIMQWRATVDAFRTFLANNPTAIELSNPDKHLLIHTTSTVSDAVNLVSPSSRDTSRTPSAKTRQKRTRSRSHG